MTHTVTGSVHEVNEEIKDKCRAMLRRCAQEYDMDRNKEILGITISRIGRF
ncbi:MAG: hypothetical protein ACOYXY_16505 [Thermodesulfobacteriota bacterium]